MERWTLSVMGAAAAALALGSALAGGVAWAEPALVANPEVSFWPSPSFRGKPFWPLFAKLSHKEPVADGAFTVTVGPGDVAFVQIGE